MAAPGAKVSDRWAGPGVTRARWWFLIVGTEGLGLLLAGATASVHQFFESYLLAYLFWLDLALGCLALTMLHHLVGGAPGLLIRRILEAGAMTLLLLAALFVPLLLGVPDLFAWARPEEVARNLALQQKALYLNVPFFEARAVVYFAVWCSLSYLLNRWSVEQDRSGDAALTLRLQSLSRPGVILYALTVSLALVDWGMSLETGWSSTIYGMLGVTAQLLVALAFAIAVALLLAHHKPLSTLVSSDRLRDLGNLLMAGILIWAYLAYSQFLITWMGNLPAEITWYLPRVRGGWQWVYRTYVAAYAILFGVLVVWRRAKRTVRPLLAVAVVAVVGHLVDRFWSIAPAFHPEGLHGHWMDIAAVVGLGGLWLASFLWILEGRSLIPLQDPRFGVVPVREKER